MRSLDDASDHCSDDADTDGEDGIGSVSAVNTNCATELSFGQPPVDCSIDVSSYSLSSAPSSTTSASIHSSSMSASLTDSSASSAHLQSRCSLESQYIQSSPDTASPMTPAQTNLRVCEDRENLSSSRQSFAGQDCSRRCNGNATERCERERTKSVPSASPALVLRELCGNLNRTLIRDAENSIIASDGLANPGNNRKKSGLEVIANIECVLESTRNERETVIVRYSAIVILPPSI